MTNMNIWFEAVSIFLMPFKWVLTTVFTADIYGISIGGLIIGMFCISVAVNALINSAKAPSLRSESDESRETRRLQQKKSEYIKNNPGSSQKPNTNSHRPVSQVNVPNKSKGTHSNGKPRY